MSAANVSGQSLSVSWLVAGARWRTLHAAVAILLGLAQQAIADEPPSPAEERDAGRDAGRGSEAAREAEKDNDTDMEPEKKPVRPPDGWGPGSALGAAVVPRSGRELGLFPILGGDTDHGFGAGAIGSVARFDGDNPVYRWKLDFRGIYLTKALPAPSFIDLAAVLTVPQMVDDQLRLEIRPSYTLDGVLPYYGRGNEPNVPTKVVPSRDFYERVHPALSVNARWRLSAHWYAVDGIQLGYTKVTTDAGSSVATQLAALDPYLLKANGILRAETGLAYDSRDNEIAPNTGQWHQVKVRASPRIGTALPYEYQQLDGIARWYTTLLHKRLVLAMRGVVDLETGHVPFYEEARYEETTAVGGTQGVRGVPAYLLYGRAKVFGNVELRAKVWRFSAVSRKWIVGFAGFVDAGRVWTDITTAHPDLDGRGLGIHYGVGGGLRIQQGRAFLVRADLAWSPDARPVGAYLIADQAF